MDEIWKPVPDFPDYEASSLGAIRRVTPTHYGPGPRLLKLANLGGYRMAYLYRGGKRHDIFAHRVVMAAFCGPLPHKHEVNHLNGVKHDNRPANLEYVTRSQNRKHSFSHLGEKVNARRGEEHCHAKMTAADVIKLRELRAGGMTYKALGERFGINQSAAHKIANRVRWKHVA